MSEYKIVKNREKIWDFAIEKTGNEQFIGLEFGVAWGYSTYYWICRCNNIIEWHGFDTFTGLPETWRHYKKGHFSNYGVPPELNCEKIEWHVGLVENTFKAKSTVCEVNEARLVVLLDLDLFFPTYHVLSEISPYLKPGDLIYFDEPHDNDEGSILHLFMKVNEGKIALIAASPCQILLEIKSTGLKLPRFR